MWQDPVLLAVQLVFCFTLIPMFFAKMKPPLATSITTGVALLVGSFAVFTLGLVWAAVGQAVVGFQWLILAYQRVRK